MSYRKLISTLVFAAFGFCFSGAATLRTVTIRTFALTSASPSLLITSPVLALSAYLHPGGASEPFNTLDIGWTRVATCNLHANRDGDMQKGA